MQYLGGQVATDSRETTADTPHLQATQSQSQSEAVDTGLQNGSCTVATKPCSGWQLWVGTVQQVEWPVGVKSSQTHRATYTVHYQRDASDQTHSPPRAMVTRPNMAIYIQLAVLQLRYPAQAQHSQLRQDNGKPQILHLVTMATVSRAVVKGWLCQWGAERAIQASKESALRAAHSALASRSRSIIQVN